MLPGSHLFCDPALEEVDVKLGSFVARLAVVGALAFALAGSVRAQDWRGRARVDGRVLSEKGEAIPGAKVTLRRAGAGPEALTDKKGRWAYLGLANGGWDVDVDAEGYLPYKTTVQLSEVTRIPPMDIRLQPAPKAEPAPQAGAGKGASPDVIAILEHGNQLLEQKDFAGARAEYEQALASVPDNPAILRAIAQTYYGEKKVDEAITTLKKVVQV